jgi:hypothetical protein
MTEKPHSHWCSDCGFEWDHDDAACDLGDHCDCEECLARKVYWIEETFTTFGFCLPDIPDREPNPLERQLMIIGGFKTTADMDRHYGALAADSSQEDMCPPQLTRGRSKPSRGREQPENPHSIEEAITLVEFSAHRKEFNEAVKYLLAGASRTDQELLEFADVNVRTSEVEFVTTGASSGLLVEVRTPGYARVPLPLFERISRAIQMLREDAIVVSIGTGVIRVAKLMFSHPQISLRLIGSRIADLPIGASLPDVLALSVRFRREEIEDSGLLARVIAAQAEASNLIDQSFESLEPLGIERSALSRFVLEQIEKRVRREKAR